MSDKPMTELEATEVLCAFLGSRDACSVQFMGEDRMAMIERKLRDEGLFREYFLHVTHDPDNADEFAKFAMSEIELYAFASPTKKARAAAKAVKARDVESSPGSGLGKLPR